MIECNEKQKEGLWVSGDAYLDDFINHRTFSAHTHTHTRREIIVIPGNQQKHRDHLISIKVVLKLSNLKSGGSVSVPGYLQSPLSLELCT